MSITRIVHATYKYIKNLYFLFVNVVCTCVTLTLAADNVVTNAIAEHAVTSETKVIDRVQTCNVILYSTQQSKIIQSMTLVQFINKHMQFSSIQEQCMESRCAQVLGIIIIIIIMNRSVTYSKALANDRIQQLPL